MIGVGFSTRPRNVVSRLVRWITGSKASHAWLTFEDTFFGLPMVMEATETGFRILPLANFKAEGNEIIAIVEPPYPLDDGLRAAVHWVGDGYDFAGLFGAVVVVIGRWFRRKWRNPLDSSRSMFCSEAVVRVLQAAKYPGVEGFDPSATTPQDLLDFFSKAGLVGAHLHRQRTP